MLTYWFGVLAVPLSGVETGRFINFECEEGSGVLAKLPPMAVIALVADPPLPVDSSVIPW